MEFSEANRELDLKTKKIMFRVNFRIFHSEKFRHIYVFYSCHFQADNQEFENSRNFGLPC